jgi:hypothetical protein
MGLFNDAYMAVAAAICTLGRHQRPPYYAIPSAKARRVQEQLESNGAAKVLEVEDTLNEAAQVNFIEVKHQLVSVEAPDWLRINEKRTTIVAPKARFQKLD